MSQEKTIREIAVEIKNSWGKINFAAKPYLDAMMTIEKISDKYHADDASSVVAYFLSNAQTWRGDDARRIKKELNELLKQK